MHRAVGDDVRCLSEDLSPWQARMLPTLAAAPDDPGPLLDVHL